MWLPTLIQDVTIACLPRSLFLGAYSPSTETLRNVSERARNMSRSFDYSLKRMRLSQ